MTDKLKSHMETAVSMVLASPDAHARLIRSSQALLAVSSIEDPNPSRAVGHMLGSAVEFALNIGLSREFVLEFVAEMYDMMKSPTADLLRDAARRQQG